MVASRVARTTPILIAVCFASLPVHAQYSGGSGTAEDPYRLATAADLIALGETPEDYNKHFVLTADIDLDPNLPGRKAFDRAVIAPTLSTDEYPYVKGTHFTGAFDGDGHAITHLTISGADYTGLFGYLDRDGHVENLRLLNVSVIGNQWVGGLAGYNAGTIGQCSVVGTIEGNYRVGGLVGMCSHDSGPVTKCSTRCRITGNDYVGGLVGFNWTADILACYSDSTVVGRRRVGGLVGISGRISSPPAGQAGPPPGTISYPPDTSISSCYSTGYVEGASQVGGLAGENRGSIQFSYSSARVEDSGLLLVDNESFGGLVGTNNHGVVLLSYWNAEVSSLSYSTAGKGKTTEQMMNADTFSGWGYTGKWVIDDGNDYPRLAWEGLEGGPFLDDPNRYAGGVGTPDDPYRIQTPDEFVRLAYHPTDWGKSFVLAGNIDLSQTDPSLISPIGVYGMPFKGSFDGNNCTISNFRHLSEAENYVGVFGSIGPEISYRSYGPMTHDPNDSGSVVNLNLENVQVLGYCCAGGLAGYNSGVISNCSVTGNVTAVSKDAGGLLGFSDGRVTDCSARGNVISGQVAGGLIAHNKGPVKNCSFYGSVENRSRCSGGLIGYNYNTVESCHFAGDITGTHDTGGLIGSNGGTVVRCSTLGSVTGDWCVGGLIGRNFGNLLNCCAMGSANGVEYVAGLIGINDKPVASCYSSCAVTGQHKTGGLVGTRNPGGEVSNSFWDVETSGQIMSAGGLGKTTAEMQMASTFLDAGWDFVAETANGPNDVWKMWDGYDYPRLAWEAGPDTPLVFVDVNDPGFHGQMSKYEVTNAQYCDFLNAALASGDISINGTKVEGADGSNSGQDHVGQLYYNGDGSGYTGYGATNGGAARIRHDAGAFGVEDGFDNHPVTYVSWYGAMAFANYYGYYLPAEDQWQAVANYDGTYIYGCGETIDPDIANYRVSEHPDGTMPVGSFGAYGHGMSDMAGNVWEWTSTSLSSNRVFRGGSLGSVESDCAVSIRGDGIPHVAYWDIGFRVCR